LWTRPIRGILATPLVDALHEDPRLEGSRHGPVSRWLPVHRQEAAWQEVIKLSTKVMLLVFLFVLSLSSVIVYCVVGHPNVRRENCSL
jgi:hypothetical protein